VQIDFETWVSRRRRRRRRIVPARRSLGRREEDENEGSRQRAETSPR